MSARYPAALAACLGLALAAPAQTLAGPAEAGLAPLPAGARLIAVGAALADTVRALGASGQLVATDDGGRELPGNAHLPGVGYARTLSAEGLLALRPDALLVGPEAGPPAVLEQVRAAGTRVCVLPLQASEEGACARVRAVAALLGRQEAGERLVAALQRDLAELRLALAGRDRPAPRVLFLYARSSTSLHAAGRGTPAEAMLALAGADNALDGVEGYTPLTPEAAVGVAPDIVVVPARSVEVLGGLQALAAHPGLALTPAVRAGRIVALDDLLLLGFGPQTGSAARQLALRLDPQLALSLAPTPASSPAGPPPADPPVLAGRPDPR